MIDKLTIIKQILETDEETDKKIFSLLEYAKEDKPKKEKTIHIEVRDCKRKQVYITAEINTGEKLIQANAEDLSMKGAFISTDQKMEKGDNIAVRIMTDVGEELAFISEVVRLAPTGIGILIKTISKPQKEKLQQFFQKL